MEHSTDGIALVDLNGHFLSANNTFAAIHGYNPEELIGKHVSIFYPYPLKDYLAINNYKINAVEEFKGEVWHMRRDGTVFPAKIYNSFLRDKEGTPIGYVMNIKEITKEKRMDKSIIKSEGADRLLLNAYTDSAFLIDTDGTILFLNERAAKDFDTHSNELIGMCLYDLLPHKREFVCKDLIGKVVHSHKPVNFSEGLVGKGRDENYCPILDENGKVVKVAIFCRDITGGALETFTVEEKEKINDSVEEKYTKNYLDIRPAPLLMQRRISQAVLHWRMGEAFSLMKLGISPLPCRYAFYAFYKKGFMNPLVLWNQLRPM